MINLNQPETLTFLSVAALLASVPDDGSIHQIRVRSTGEVIISSEPEIGNINLAGFLVYFESFTAGGYVGPGAASDFDFVAEIYQTLKDNWPVNALTFVDDFSMPSLYPTKLDGGVEVMPPSSPPDITELSGDEAKDEIVQWVVDNYEDPVHSTPIDGGEYQYIWGGPFDARELIADEFSGEASEEVLDLASEELESISLLWVPHQNRHQWVGEWGFPSELIKKELAESAAQKVLETIEVARKHLVALKHPHGAIGHNLPPSEIPSSPFSEFEIEALETAMDEVEAAAATSINLPAKLGEALSTISEFVGKAGRWFANTVDSFIQEAAKSAGKSVGLALGPLLLTYVHWDGLVAALERLLSLFV